MPSLSFTVSALAKVNLYLGVYTTKDERGYHRVDSVMAAVGRYGRRPLPQPCDAPHRKR